MAFSTSGWRSSVGTQRIERLGFDVEAHDEPIGESRLFDLEVLRRGSRAPPSAFPGCPSVLERHPQQIAEPHQRPVRRLDVLVHQRRDRVQGVEQEVRLQLLLQRRHPRFDELGLELRGAQRPGRATRDSRAPRD